MKPVCHKYKQLSITEREEIAIMNSVGTIISDIARRIGRNKSTVSWELIRHRYKARNSNQ
ncbi:MAG: helix-turn-helix domain-containing protein [Rickettsiales bacterium]|jgi:IS30 family transposase|nr:helix-turn-helix domain-containing protein [Rickettsiales bacterium]